MFYRDLSIMVMQMTFNPSDIGSNPIGLIFNIFMLNFLSSVYIWLLGKWEGFNIIAIYNLMFNYIFK